MTFYVREGELFRRYTETHVQRGYTPAQMVRLLEQAGLQVLEMGDADSGGVVH